MKLFILCCLHEDCHSFLARKIHCPLTQLNLNMLSISAVKIIWQPELYGETIQAASVSFFRNTIRLMITVECLRFHICYHPNNMRDIPSGLSALAWKGLPSLTRYAFRRWKSRVTYYRWPESTRICHFVEAERWVLKKKENFAFAICFQLQMTRPHSVKVWSFWIWDISWLVKTRLAAVYLIFRQSTHLLQMSSRQD